MMIEKLKGIYDVALPNGLILDVQGVGYGVEMPLSALCALPPIGTPMQVWTYTYVREDAIKLYGFLTYEDRYIFEVLISLNGVGPKIALAILSTLDLNAIKLAVAKGSPEVFEVVPGIGARMAEKIIVEMKSKMRRLATLHHQGANSQEAQRFGAEDFSGIDAPQLEGGLHPVMEDLRSALENLGFRDKAVNGVLQKLQVDHGDRDFQFLMRLALKELGGVRVGDRSAGEDRKTHDQYSDTTR